MARMTANWKKALWGLLVVPFIPLVVWLCLLYRTVSIPLPVYQPPSLRLVVADPLCRPWAGTATKSERRRDYGPLAAFLEVRLSRPIELLYSDDLGHTLPENRGSFDLIAGQASVVSFAADQVKETVRPVVRLAGRDGTTEVCGLFVVRESDPARTIGDLADHRIVFGPPQEEERRAAALTMLTESGITPIPPLRMIVNCRDAIQAVAKGDADAAVVPDYARSLLEGQETESKESLRVVGRTAPLPFITVFVTGRVGPQTEQTILNALLSVAQDSQVLTALGSQTGFVAWDAQPPAPATSPEPVKAPVVEWTDWRGPGRAAVSPDVPTRLPEHVRLLWKRGLTGAGLSGVAATATHVVVADKNPGGDQDIWRCLEADTGKELWTVAYATPTKMEFTNAPRATPVLHEGYAYLLGAFGDLYCVSLHGHRLVWRRNIIEDFGAKLPPWGLCSTPLVVGDSLVVNPGAENASLVALGLYAGEVLWQTPGAPAAYGSLLLGTFGGVRQIVGYDAVSLGGWDPNTGQRLWTLQPSKKGDYNVPTPINVDGRLLVATENNGTRLYGFDSHGRIQPTPLACNSRFAPDSSTPVIIDGLVFGCFRGLYCLDLNDLEIRYAVEDDNAFTNYAAFIAGNGHVLAITVHGELVLLKAAPEGFTPVSRLQVFPEAEVWSYPALVGQRLYIRSMKEVCCLLLDTP
jgi:outer membrane protein assembly factor BamB